MSMLSKIFVTSVNFIAASHALSYSSPSTKFPNFWNDPISIQSLHDPPSPELLSKIQAKPYRGGLEPAFNIPKTTPKIVHGKIPKELKGKLASNGAGRIRIRDRQYGHWFDGDGYITLLSIDGVESTVSFQASFVPTKRYIKQQKYEDEESDRKSTYLTFSGPWTMAGNEKWYENLFRLPTNPANTATMWLPPSSDTPSSTAKEQPRLFALCEGGHPIELHPETLKLVQQETPLSFNDSKETASSFFSAHFSKCSATNHYFNHGYRIRPGPLTNQINVMELDESGNLIQQKITDLPFDAFVHDSTITQNLFLYFVPPYYIPNESIYDTLRGSSPLAKGTIWDENQSSKLYVHSKHDLKLNWIIELPHQMSLYHIIDAHELEEADDKIKLSIRVCEHISLDRMMLEQQFADQYSVEDSRILTKPMEYIYLLHKNDKASSSLLSYNPIAKDAAFCEYPVVHGDFDPSRKNRYCWTNAASSDTVEWLDGLQKIDMEEGTVSDVITFGEGSYAGPPAFVPRRNKNGTLVGDQEDDGFIFTTIYRSKEHRSDVAILDASSLDVLCLMELEHHVPFQFHGDYWDEHTANTF